MVRTSVANFEEEFGAVGEGGGDEVGGAAFAEVELLAKGGDGDGEAADGKVGAARRRRKSDLLKELTSSILQLRPGKSGMGVLET